jgi:hypothetical protein
LHQAQRFVPVDLGKSLLRSRVVQIEEFDSLSLVETLRTLRASSAQVAGSIEQYSEFRHLNTLGATSHHFI